MPELTSPRVLRTDGAQLTQVPAFSSEGQSRCDGRGNLYFRPNLPFTVPAVFMMSHDGSEHMLYKLNPADLEGEEVGYRNFTITADGAVWIIADNLAGGVRAFRFSEDGSLAKKVTVEAPQYVRPDFFSVFENGSILLSGSFRQEAGKQNGRPYVGLFDASGRRIKTFDSKQSEGEKKQGQKLPEGFAVTGEDNDLYFLRGDRISVFSSNGELLRDLPFKKPDPSMAAVRLDVSEGLLAITFLRHAPRGRETMRLEASHLVLRAQDGREFGYYVPEEELGNNVACFTRKTGFTFLRVENGNVKLLQAPLN